MTEPVLWAKARLTDCRSTSQLLFLRDAYDRYFEEATNQRVGFRTFCRHLREAGFPVSNHTGRNRFGHAILPGWGYYNGVPK